MAMLAVQVAPVKVQWICGYKVKSEACSVGIPNAEWLCLLSDRWQKKALLQANLCPMMINHQAAATVSVTSNQESGIKQ
jgi:hypothetical protein